MLSSRLAGYLGYFESLALQPANRWDGFYLTTKETQHFGLRYQIAFACFALGIVSLHPDAELSERERCYVAMENLIDRMLQRRVWAYWAMDAERHGLNPDPLVRGNVQYGGLLLMMLGMFEMVSGNPRFDEPFTLLWTGKERFSYSFHTLAYALAQQMQDSHYSGIESLAGRVAVNDMSGVMWGLLLHDIKHQSLYSELVERWLTFVDRHMVCGSLGALSGGVFRAWYQSQLHLAIPMSLGVVDGLTLALLCVLERERVARWSPRFLRRVRRVQHGETGGSQAFVPTSKLWHSLEVANEGLTTGAGYVLAVELGNRSLASEFLHYADTFFQPVEQNRQRSYQGMGAAPLVTALFALGEAGGLQVLYDVMQGQEPPRNPPRDQREQVDGEQTDREQTGIEATDGEQIDDEQI